VPAFVVLVRLLYSKWNYRYLKFCGGGSKLEPS
jgi:hypothetical protein